MKLYFAYGSNMSLEQMRRRCPESRRLGQARLAGYRWIITQRGYANVVSEADGEVEGILYALSSADQKRLDNFEGVAAGQYHTCMCLVQHEGRNVEALVYIDPIVEEGTPQEEYIHRINAALVDARLSAAYVNQAIRRFIPPPG